MLHNGNIFDDLPISDFVLLGDSQCQIGDLLCQKHLLIYVREEL